MKPGLYIAAFLFSVIAYAQDTKVNLTAPPAQENINAPEITFEEEVFNFGAIKQGDSITHTFSFTNTGKEPLIITSASAVCGCTVPDWPRDPIKPGEKRNIKVTFKSAGKVGIQDRTVTIQSNAKTNPKIIHMKGTVENATQVNDPAVIPPKN